MASRIRLPDDEALPRVSALASHAGANVHRCTSDAVELPAPSSAARQNRTVRGAVSQARRSLDAPWLWYLSPAGALMRELGTPPTWSTRC